MHIRTCSRKHGRLRVKRGGHEKENSGGAMFGPGGFGLMLNSRGPGSTWSRYPVGDSCMELGGHDNGVDLSVISGQTP